MPVIICYNLNDLTFNKNKYMGGTNWQQEVGSPLSDRPTMIKRERFYADRAKLKILRLQKDIPNLDAVLDDPNTYGFKSAEDLKQTESRLRSESQPFTRNIERGGGNLFEILKNYFRSLFPAPHEISIDQAEKEAYLSLYYITNKVKKDDDGKKVNVDLLRPGMIIYITGGRLYIHQKPRDLNSSAEIPVVNGVDLRKPAASAPTSRPASMPVITSPPVAPPEPATARVIRGPAVIPPVPTSQPGSAAAPASGPLIQGSAVRPPEELLSPNIYISEVDKLLGQFRRGTREVILEGPFEGEEPFNYKIRQFLLTDLQTLHQQTDTSAILEHVTALLQARNGLRLFADQIFAMEMAMRRLLKKKPTTPPPSQDVQDKTTRLEQTISIAHQLQYTILTLETSLLQLKADLTPIQGRKEPVDDPHLKIQRFITTISHLADRLDQP